MIVPLVEYVRVVSAVPTMLVVLATLDRLTRWLFKSVLIAPARSPASSAASSANLSLPSRKFGLAPCLSKVMTRPIGAPV